MATFLDQLFKSPIIFFIIAAVILIVLAIIGKIPWPSTIDLDARQRVGLATFGTILIVLSVVITSIEATPSPGASGKTQFIGPAGPPVTTISSCSSSSSPDVRIISPGAESAVPVVTIMQGIACNIPADQEIWIIIVPDGVTRYYPQLPGPVMITSDGKWSTSVHVGLDQPDQIGKGFELNVMLANQDGSTAIHAYFNQAGPDFKGLDSLRGGLQLISQVHVIRK
ncbi:MAG TPA: hypothetical protein VFB60_14875 [Ktedonobacteraceae bacterium]|nr:hypothetical protein [Ktedonobacteraceae bacterium]